MVCSVSFVSCSSNNKKSTPSNEAASVAVAGNGDSTIVEDVSADGNYVYCCAYDGFVNIREVPSMKGRIVGKFRNGPHGAVLLSNEGEWTKIDIDGIVGFVASKYVCKEPTVAVDDGIDLTWLEGLWEDLDAKIEGSDFILYMGLLIFDNGEYAEYNMNFNEGSFVAFGSYKLEGHSLVLNKKRDLVNSEDCDETIVLDLNPSNKAIQGYKKVRYLTKEEAEIISNSEEWEGADGLMLTREEFKKMPRIIRARALSL